MYMGPDNRNQTVSVVTDVATLRDFVAELIRLHGVARAARMVGISPESLARFHGGLDVRAGTLALIRERKAAAVVALRKPGGVSPSEPPPSSAA